MVTPDQATRRPFLQRAPLGMLGWAVTRNLIAAPTAAASIPQAGKKKRILNAKIGNAVRRANCSADVWTTTWAEDDNLYSVGDDTTGFNKACDSDLAVHRISGGRPLNIVGETVNPMKEFGGASEQTSRNVTSNHVVLHAFAVML
jgi:hypothetical protein